MEAFYDLVKRLVKGFEVAGVDYVFTGALAASFYGAPRTTGDVDVVVAVAGVKQRVRLVEALKRAGTVAGLSCFYQTPEELILAKLRMIKATKPRERALKDEEDVKAILRFTEVDMDGVRQKSRKDSTFSILEEILK